MSASHSMKEAGSEVLKVRGLARIPARIFAAWGAIVAAKGLWDVLGFGEPEANLYAPAPWTFVTREQWLRYGFFELAYGASCLALAWLLWRYSRFLPEKIVRPRREPAFDLFA
ncbi:MAG: hypothetical protein HY554_02530 [Elusimicrobia bacterium]|nr:hypothetical protein [Elusimicrobiota bacterium]